MDVIWFRPPAGDAGTLNACYNAVDVHVIRGRAEQVALLDGERPLTFARLLTEVGAFAGVLQAFGVRMGDEVVVLDVPPFEDTVLQLACARVGAVVFRELSPTPALAVVGTAGRHDLGAVPLITVDDSGELDVAHCDARRAHRSGGLCRGARRRSAARRRRYGDSDRRTPARGRSRRSRRPRSHLADGRLRRSPWRTSREARHRRPRLDRLDRHPGPRPGRAPTPTGSAWSG